MQALTPRHNVDKRDKPNSQSSGKPNRTGNKFGTYLEVTSEEGFSTEDLTHKTPGRLLMMTGWVQQDQLKWL